MSIKYTYKVKQVATTVTAQQAQDALNSADTEGYEFVGLFTLGSGTSAKFFAVFKKIVQGVI